MNLNKEVIFLVTYSRDGLFPYYCSSSAISKLKCGAPKSVLSDLDSSSNWGTSLVVQWLQLCAPNVGALGSIPDQGTRSHMSQLRPGTAQ